MNEAEVLRATLQFFVNMGSTNVSMRSPRMLLTIAVVDLNSVISERIRPEAFGRCQRWISPVYVPSWSKGSTAGEDKTTKRDTKRTERNQKKNVREMHHDGIRRKEGRSDKEPKEARRG